MSHSSHVKQHAADSGQLRRRTDRQLFNVACNSHPVSPLRFAQEGRLPLPAQGYETSSKGGICSVDQS